MLFAVDVIQEINGIFNNTVADIAVIASGLRGRSGFADDNTFA